MAEQIYSVCDNAGVGHCRVLFEPVRHPLTASGPLGAEPLQSGIFQDDWPFSAWALRDELAEDVPMGSSCGPVTEDAQVSASMGGSITLQGDDKESSTMLMSVFHPFESLLNEGKLAPWSPSVDFQMYQAFADFSQKSFEMDGALDPVGSSSCECRLSTTRRRQGTIMSARPQY